MIDYREELDFKLALITFIVKNFSENSKGKRLLTIEKLRLLTFICLTPKKLDIVSRRLTEKKMSHLKNVFYNDSSEIFDAKDVKEVSLLIAYMCNEKLLNIIREESNFVVSGEKSGEILSVINDSIPQYLSKNIKLINSISKKSESLITKALLGL